MTDSYLSAEDAEARARKIETMAKRIQGEINLQIANECETASPYEWQARADRIAEETPGIGDWEYIWNISINAPPKIVLTRYDPPRENRMN